MLSTVADKKHGIHSKKILYSAAKLFLEQGYSATSLRSIADDAGISLGSLTHSVGSKENIMSDLVLYVLNEQFNITEKIVGDKTDDVFLFYAAETTLQLYIAETNEHVRELYSVAYSLPDSSKIIYNAITKKFEEFFGNYFPEMQTKDFYEIEIATGGIMRGYMTVPCDMYFTMEQKVKRFIETTFRVLRSPESKINEAIEFVSQFDYKKIAEDSLNSMLDFLKKKIEKAEELKQ